jgi:hypothetical protein
VQPIEVDGREWFVVECVRCRHRGPIANTGEGAQRGWNLNAS